MRAFSLLGLPSSLLLLIAARVGAENPTAIRKMSPNAGEKLLPDDLAFAKDVFDTPLTPHEKLLAARMADDPFLYNASYPHRPPFAPHSSQAGLGWEHFRRAIDVLNLLEKRQACPTKMNSCETIGSPDKCCMTNEVCVKVVDESVGNVACCPAGASCNGPVGICPIGTTSCAADVGGGCCIPGYVCQGSGCVPSHIATATTATATATATNGGGGGGGGGGSTGGGGTVTSVRTVTSTTVSTTTLADGSTTTVVVIVTVTQRPGTVTTTSTSTSTETPANPTTVPPTTAVSTGGAVPPFRPTSTTEGDTNTAPFCPTGFYACLARAGGGCCQTGRDCATTSCPPTPSTTIISNGATIIVPVTDVPASATETCASGWFLCGEEGGPVAGCCPSGYACGTASCTTSSSTQTGEIQKQFPNSGSRIVASFAVVALSMLAALF
ncbi:hypothetical protein CcaCcLH18_01394 [Colletotrichum camelliae]|nr:hypothetical protein CcaCcLH18_01394 [Colletotrichum camelliae]